MHHITQSISEKLTALITKLVRWYISIIQCKINFWPALPNTEMECMV